MATTHSLTRGLGFLAMATLIAGGIAYVLRPRHMALAPKHTAPAELSPEWKAVEGELDKKVRTAQTTPYHGMTMVEADAGHWAKRLVWDGDTYQYRQHALRFFGALPREAQSAVLHGNTVYVSMDTDEHIWKVPYGAGDSVAYYRSEWQDPNDATKQHYAIVADAISGSTRMYDWLFIPIADHIVVGSDDGRQKRLRDALKTMEETYRAIGDLDLSDIAGLGGFNEFDLKAIPIVPPIGPQSEDCPWLKLQSGPEITFYSLLSPDQRARAFRESVPVSALTPEQRDTLTMVVIDRARLTPPDFVYKFPRPVGIYSQSQRLDAESHTFDPVSFSLTNKGVFDSYQVLLHLWKGRKLYESLDLDTVTEAFALPLARKEHPDIKPSEVARQRTHKYDLKVGVTGGYTYTIPMDVTTAVTLEELWRLRKVTP